MTNKQPYNHKVAVAHAMSEEMGRIPPQARELEEAILGAILLEKNAFDIAAEFISSECFYDRTHELIFEALQSLNDNNKPIDLLTVVEELRKRETLDSIGGVPYLAQLTQKVVSSAHLEYHCKIVKDKYIARKTIEVCSEMTSEAFSDITDVAEIVDTLSDKTEQIQTMMLGESESGEITEVSKESYAMLLDRFNNFKLGKTTGIPTGFVDLDNLLTGGWKENKMIVLAGRPSHGKSSCALKFTKTAAEHNYPVVFFSLEMDRTELYDKLVIGESKVDSYRYNTGNLTQGEMRAIEESKQKIDKLPIIIDDTPGITMPKIASKLRLYKKQGKCKMAVIDYIQLITPTGKDGNREQEVSRISRAIKTTAKSLSIPIIALSQMNRGFEKEKGRLPQLADLRESGAIEQDTDIVTFVYRPGKFNEPVTDVETNEILVNCLKLITQKHRGGRTGSVKVKFNESMTEFYDWDNSGYLATMPAENYPQQQQEQAPF